MPGPLDSDSQYPMQIHTHTGKQQHGGVRVQAAAAQTVREAPRSLWLLEEQHSSKQQQHASQNAPYGATSASATPRDRPATAYT